MPITVTSWLRLYFALHERAIDRRGVVEVRNHEDDVVRWPRTRGGDVIEIASLLDPYLRAQPLRFGGHGLARRWRACVDEVARCSVQAEYPHNQTFWPAVAAICVYLHAQRAPL